MGSELRDCLSGIELTEPVYVAVRILSRAGFEGEALAALRGAGRAWLGVLVALIEVGERCGAWSQAELEKRAGDLTLVLRALQAEGPEAELAVRCARHVRSCGAESYQAVHAAVAGWMEGEPARPERVIPAAPELGEQHLSAEDLLKLNVNQHTGNRYIHGWFKKEEFLFLYRKRIDHDVLSELEQRGVLLSSWEGQPAGPRLQFSIKAGERRFSGVVAVDLRALEREVGAGWSGVAEAWGEFRHPVREVVGMGHGAGH